MQRFESIAINAKTAALLTFFMLSVFALPTPVSAQSDAQAKSLSFTIASKEPVSNDAGTGFLDQVIAEMFKRIGVEAEVVYYTSSARGLKNANDGVDDGVGLRVAGLEKKFPNLVRIPESIIVNDFVAFSTRNSIKTDNWNALDGQDISYILGWQIFDNNLKHHQRVVKSKNNDQLFTLLANDRVEFILHERWQGTWHSIQHGLKVKISEPPLAQREMFAYVHKKHAGLVDKAAAALVEMKADGSYQEIINTTLTVLLPRP